MKKGLLLLFLFSVFLSFSQVPQRINYQGVARYSDGTPILNKPIGIRLQILQGSASGSPVFSENHSVSTGSFGVFSLQIGSVNTLTVVNWTNGSYFLEVAIDSLNGTNFLVMGTQQLMSVPYALYAGGAPSPTLSFNTAGNILNVGSNTVAIQTGSSIPSQSTTINTTGAISSTLTGNTYNLFTPTVNVVPAQFIPGVADGIAQVLGSFPNYTIKVAPVIAYNPTVGLLTIMSQPFTSPSYSTSYNITPQLGITGGNILSVGPPSNSILIPTGGTFVATPNTSLTSSGGLVNITQLGTNNFDLNVSPITFTGAGSATVTGGPNYTITTPAAGGGGTVSLSQGGAITITGVGVNSYNIFTPSVTVGASPTGLGSVTGSFPNYVMDVNPTFSYNNATGSLVVANSASPAISYSYNITPTLSFSGGVLTSGPASNSVTIPGASTPSLSFSSGVLTSGPASNSVIIPGSATPTIVGTDAATVTTSGNSYTVNVPVTTVTGTNGINVTGNAPNFTISSTASTFTGNGAATVSSSGNNYTVSVPVTTVVGTGNINVSGSAPNFTVSSAASTFTGDGAATVTSSGNNYTVSVPVTTVVGTGNINVAGSAPNFTVSSAASTFTGDGAATVTSSGNNYTVSVPVTTVVGAGDIVVTGSAPNFTVSASMPTFTGTGAAAVVSAGDNYTVSVPVTTVSGTGGATVTGTAPDFTVNAPQQVSITAVGATTIGGTYPNLTIGSRSVTVDPFLGGGLASFLGSYPNYSITVAPTVAYSQTTGSLVLTNPTIPANSYSYNITPALTKTNTILQSGPPTNTVDISVPLTATNNIIQSGSATNTVAITSPSAQAFTLSGGTLIVLAGSQLGSTAFTKQSASTELEVFAYLQVSTAVLALGRIVLEIMVDGNLSLVSAKHVMGSNTTEFVTLRAIFSGLSAGSHTASIRAIPTNISVTTVTLDPNSYGAKLILKETY